MCENEDKDLGDHRSQTALLSFYCRHGKEDIGKKDIGSRRWSGGPVTACCAADLQDRGAVEVSAHCELDVSVRKDVSGQSERSCDLVSWSTSCALVQAK